MKHLIRTCLLALLLCLCILCAAQAQSASLTLSSSAQSGYGGDEITVSLALTAEEVGGLQTTLTWNSGCLTYVEGSAAFSDAFISGTMMAMINDGSENSITLVYGNINGYTAQDEVIFTARFRLNDGVSGDTTFSLISTKATDASASLSALMMETNTVCVSTAIFDAGSVCVGISVSNTSPNFGKRTTVTLTLESCTEAIGSLQGTFHYDPNVLQYVPGSAAFSDEASAAGMTMLINADTPGEVRFVYASVSGYSSYRLVSMEFEVIGGVNSRTTLYMDGLKATNARTDRLAMMNVSSYGYSISPQGEPSTVYLTTWLHEGNYIYVDFGSQVTLGVNADGRTFSGLQAVISYDPEWFSYVPGSAAFTDGFMEGASITLINDSVAGELRLVYVNPDGYTPDTSEIFTAKFVTRKRGTTPKITVTTAKATNTGAELTSVPVQAQTNMYLTVRYGNYDMSGVKWDYTTASTYDGTEKTVQLTGLPEGVTAIYSNNTATEPGSYYASVTFEYDSENYNRPSMSGVSWYINKITFDMSDVAWDYPGSFVYDGTEKTVQLTGLPEGLTVTYSGNTATEPGSYYASVTFQYDSAHYNNPSSVNNLYWNIAKLTFDMSGVSWDYTDPFVYDGTEKSVQLTGLPDGLTAAYSGNTATEPGSYYATVTFQYDSAHYNKPCNVNGIYWYINKITFDMSGVAWDYTDPFVYDGTEQSVQLTGLPEGLTPVYTQNTAIEPGSYYASVTFKYDTAHYNAPSSVSGCSWSIGKGNYDLSGVTWDYTVPFAYDGTEKSVQLVGLPEGLVPYYSGNTATELGTYYAVATFQYDREHYNKPDSLSCSWSIDKGEYDLSGVTWNYTVPFAYDGTEKSVYLVGLPEGLIPSYSGNAAAELGTYNAVATFQYDAEHYNEPGALSCSWSIGKGNYDLSGVTWDYTVPFTYDGTEKSVHLVGLPEGLVPCYSGNTATGAGTYYAVATFQYDVVHYNEPGALSCSWSIDKGYYDLSGVKWAYPTAFTYDGTEKSVQLTGLPEGITAIYSNNTATEPGNYTATVTFEYDEQNYNRPTVLPSVSSIYWYIYKRTFDMSGVQWDYTDAFTYDGTEKAIRLTGLPEGLTAVYTGNTATEPGSYYASVTFQYDAACFYAPASVSGCYWYINKITFDMSGVAWDYTDPFVYDGTEKSIQLTGLPEGLTPVYTNNTATEPGSYFALVTLQYDSAHYNRPSSVSSCIWYINKATYDLSGVTWDYDEPFVYDGTEKSVHLVGLPEGLVPSYSGNTATEPGERTAYANFTYDSAHYNNPGSLQLQWSIIKIVATEIQVAPGLLVLSTDAPWNQAQYSCSLLPEGCVAEELVFTADPAVLLSCTPDRVVANAPGTTTIIIQTADGRLSASCEVIVVDSFSKAALPSGLTVIEEEAFCGASGLEVVILPETVTTIGSRAFADSGLLYIRIPANVMSIAPDAFAGTSLQGIYCPAGSTAASFAEASNIPWFEY